MSEKPDPFELRKLYKYLRVVDVCDAMDGLGYFNIGLMWPEIRPLSEGAAAFADIKAGRAAAPKIILKP